MTYQGVRNWPPVWTREFGPETYAAGEVGTLEEVRRSVLDNQCYLAIQYNGSRYVGFLQCDDREFFEKVYHSLMQAAVSPFTQLVNSILISVRSRRPRPPMYSNFVLS